MNATARHLTVTALALAVIAGGIAIAGPLSPPAGPVAGSFKTLSEVEPRTPISSLPFTINTSGSYYLTANLTGALGQDGITVNADDVTIDLNGFTMTGAAGQVSAVKSAQHTNLTVRNGGIKGWAASGLTLLLCNQTTIDSLSIRNCPNLAVFTGHNATVRSCAVFNSGSITIGDGGIVESCGMTDVTGGINTGNGAVVRGCAVRNCTDGGGAIYTTDGSTVTDCTVTGGSTPGINVANGSTVTGCTVRGTSSTGFLIGGMCTVTNNTSTGNNPASAGFEINGSGNRIDGNLSVGNGYGFRSTWSDNLIVRNAARANTSGNYALGGTNESAQIITSPGANFVATNPWANFAY
jgi:hypothetical protein